MKGLEVRAVTAVFATVLALTLGCGDDGVVTRPVDPILCPVIDSAWASPVIVNAGGEVALAVAASDPEGDPLTYHWYSAAGSIDESGPSATWTAPEAEGAYTVRVEVRDDQGCSVRDSVRTGVLNGTLLIQTRDGITAFRFDGTRFEFLPDGHPIEVLGTRVFQWGYTGIIEYDDDGSWLSSVWAREEGTFGHEFTILPDGGWAALNNEVDSVFVMGPDGSVRARVPVPNPSIETLQNMHGVVTDDRLVVSENGHDEIFAVNLSTYDTYVVFSFRESIETVLGAIECTGTSCFVAVRTNSGHRIRFFTPGSAVSGTLATLPEGNITGMVLAGSHMFAVTNFGNSLFGIDTFTGRVVKILDDLNRPEDIAYLPVALTEPDGG